MSKKDIYYSYDGHDRPDNVQHRDGLIGRYFDWQDLEHSVPGYSQRANHFVTFNRNDTKKLLGLSDVDVAQLQYYNIKLPKICTNFM
jgi:hypothetical protein